MKIDIERLTIRELSELLTLAGADRNVNEEIERDISSGAPVNEDGTINLKKYIAYLSQRFENEAV